MNIRSNSRDFLLSFTLHGTLILALIAAPLALDDYHQGNLARIMVLASFALGYNILFGYTGLLSLGHALFFASGMYGAALIVQLAAAPALIALLTGLGAGLVVAALIGFLALRTKGVGFMIVTLMFAQAGYLTILLAGEWTRGDEGFVVPQTGRMISGLDLSSEAGRYTAAFILFAVSMGLCMALVNSKFGQVLVAIRENEERTRMLGYNIKAYKLGAMVVSGGLSALAGSFYALLFGYAGASFATVTYSILPLLYVLVGGAGTILGPFVGTLFMFYMIETATDLTTAYLLLVGLVLVLVTLFAPHGLMGEVRRRLWRGLP